MLPQTARLLTTFVLASLVTIGISILTDNDWSICETQSNCIVVPSFSQILTIFREAEHRKEEYDCLRDNIFFEARSESVRGQEAVALVTVARSKNKHFPNSICGVVHQGIVHNGIQVRNKCQFSWFCSKRPQRVNLDNKIDQQAWIESGMVAQEVLSGQVKDFLGNATHYHTLKCHPFWAKAFRFKKLAIVGKHVFYRDSGLFHNS